MNEVQLSMNTPYARDLSTRIMNTQFIQDGLDEAGNEIEAPLEALQMYDYAIRKGDIPYLDWMTSTYRHYDVPILNTDPFFMLDNANHEALLWLDEQDYTVLPDIVRAIIYDDPMLLYTRDITKDIVKQILSRGAWEIFLEYKDEVLYTIRNICMDDISYCNTFMQILANTRKEDTARYDIVLELLKEQDIQRIYNKYTQHNKL